jgi:predicted DNA-binding protein
MIEAAEMPVAKSLRQSVSLPAPVAQRVRALAKSRRASANRMIVELIEAGLEAKEQERKRFFELSERLPDVKDPSERQQIKEELAKMIFGC